MREDNGKLGKTYVYTYDNGGNILSKQTYALTAENSTPGNAIVANAYSYGNPEWGDQLTAFNGTSITYNAIGNPVSYYNGNSTYSFVWNGRQLAKAVVNGKVYTLKYNDEGIRTSKTKSGVTTTYYLNGSQIISEETSGTATVYLYDAAGRPAGMKCYSYDGSQPTLETYWFDHNLQGDVIGVYSKTGAKLASYLYDAWGNFTVTYSNGGASIPAVVNNPFRYRGYYYDVDLGLYYLQSRYYDANTGRFISPDDVTYLGANGDLNSYNLYAYCSNNPVMYADPSGHGIIFAIVIAAITAGFISTAVVDCADDGEVFNGSISVTSYIANMAVSGFVGSFMGLFIPGSFATVSAMTIASSASSLVYTAGVATVTTAGVMMFSRPNSGRIRFSDGTGIDPETQKIVTEKQRAYEIYRSLKDKLQKARWRQWMKSRGWRTNHLK